MRRLQSSVVDRQDLSCAFYLAEKGYKPTIFEKNERAGGMLVYGIPSFKLEKDVVQAEIDIIKEMGVEIKTGVEVGKDITLDELRAQGYKAFYIAIGCQGDVFRESRMIQQRDVHLQLIS